MDKEKAIELSVKIEEAQKNLDLINEEVLSFSKTNKDFNDTVLNFKDFIDMCNEELSLMNKIKDEIYKLSVDNVLNDFYEKLLKIDEVKTSFFENTNNLIETNKEFSSNINKKTESVQEIIIQESKKNRQTIFIFCSISVVISIIAFIIAIIK